MWYDEAVIYQIYPLGLCGAPLQNDGDPSQACLLYTSPSPRDSRV